MHRTTIMLPTLLKNKAIYSAQEEGVSLGEFIRESLEIRFNISKTTKIQERDCFFAEESVFEESTPHDLAINHDNYLY